MHESSCGTSRHFAAMPNFGRDGTKPDVSRDCSQRTCSSEAIEDHLFGAIVVQNGADQILQQRRMQNPQRELDVVAAATSGMVQPPRATPKGDAAHAAER